ncbi:hypothetical protein [Microbacterium sp. Clip185]|uniref:hypothetical protein n=1 Tax=Microbacterium sp. Clip185 TaxID=3025663 RepID=UPI002366DF17|nr:hypothetical protein [Microbacterium sp. Clip185]WDG17706.1 hypothetical protein PQV94_13925 [Microbacterium sp. Clip185]
MTTKRTQRSGALGLSVVLGTLIALAPALSASAADQWYSRHYPTQSQCHAALKAYQADGITIVKNCHYRSIHGLWAFIYTQ